MTTTTIYMEDRKVLELLKKYEKANDSETTYEALESLIRNVIDFKSKVTERTYNRMYSSSNLVLKNLAIKCAPENWLREKIMHENVAGLVGAMLERIDKEEIKFDADKLLNAANHEVRFYAAEYASTDAIYKRLAIETEQVVIHELLKKL